MKIKLFLITAISVFLTTVGIIVFGQSSETCCFSEERPGHLDNDKVKANEIVKFFENLHKKMGVDGYVLVARSGAILAEDGFGGREINDDDTISRDDGFVIGSLSKPFNEAALRNLESRGLLSMQDKICNFIPDFCVDRFSQITIDQIVSHTAGLPREGYNRWDRFKSLVISGRLPDTWSPSDAGKIELVGTPGAQELYSNLGYQILASLIEKVSNQTYPEAMRHLVFSKPGLSNMRVFDPDDPKSMIGLVAPRVSRVDANGIVDREPLLEILRRDRSYGADGIIASAQDLLAWDRTLRESQDSQSEKTRVKICLLSQQTHCGSWAVSDSPSGPIQWHTGVRPGYSSGLFRLLDGDFTVIYLLATDVHQSEIKAALDEFFLLVSGHPYREVRAISQ